MYPPPFYIVVLTLSLLIAIIGILKTTHGFTSTTESEVEPNANHIFNAIHSSMRQWGSSVHHNGMSIFLATVPQGTKFYHGTFQPEPITGTQWLAFEPEQATLFARGMRFPPPGKPPCNEWERKHKFMQQPKHRTVGKTPGDCGPETGWVHTYATVRDLRLLYVDGMSAGKSQIGTLDTQERVILNNTEWSDPVFNALERAERICKIARDNWKGRIDGVIRMEAGFEIILCSFERDLNLLRTARVKPFDQNDDVSEPGDKNFGRFRIIRSLAAQYHGVGGDKVRLDYEDFVTAYNGIYDLDLFNGLGSPNTTIDNDSRNGLPRFPRLAHLPHEKVNPIYHDLTNLILTRDVGKEKPSFNWQAVTDMIVQRYADDLKYILSGTFKNREQIQAEILRFLEPFIDFDDRNPILEMDRCSNQFLPSSPRLRASLPGRAIRSVTGRICATLAEALLEPSYETIVGNIEELIEYLAWSVWKECRGCTRNEICFLPMWPWGTLEDYKNPRCRGPHNIESEGENYWGLSWRY